MSAMDELIGILDLEPIEENLFRGGSPPDARQRIFGGQVVAQALTAAYRTIGNGAVCHSLQSYFIRPGDPSRPVLYQVERSREGRSFMTRRVIAIQKGEQIFNMACSFQLVEDGYDHQEHMPQTIAPLAAPDGDDLWRDALKDDPEQLKRAQKPGPIELRPVNPIDLRNPAPAPHPHAVWVRARADAGDDVALNQVLLAYASDYSLLGTALRPHGVSWLSGVQTASLDHILWFHRPTNFSRWHLYVMDSPSASGARGFNRGSVFREDGVLVASAAQEGLMRPPRGNR